jgi:hypothetical protein
MHEFRIRDMGSLVVFAGLCCAIAGCGSDGQAVSSDAGHNSESAATPSDISSVQIDACSLLTPDDVATVLQTSVSGLPTGSGPDTFGCIWENQATYESVSLEIGNPGTAVNNTLPPPEPGFPEVGRPGPGGMWFLGNGMVEFPAGGRSNTLQVAVLRMSGDEANAVAVELAKKVGPQIPQ